MPSAMLRFPLCCSGMLWFILVLDGSYSQKNCQGEMANQGHHAHGVCLGRLANLCTAHASEPEIDKVGRERSRWARGLFNVGILNRVRPVQFWLYSTGGAFFQFTLWVPVCLLHESLSWRTTLPVLVCCPQARPGGRWSWCRCVAPTGQGSG